MSLTDRERELINGHTVLRYRNIARDLRALADTAEREAARIGEPPRNRTDVAIDFVQKFHNDIPNLGLTSLIHAAIEADATEAQFHAEREAEG